MPKLVFVFPCGHEHTLQGDINPEDVRGLTYNYERPIEVRLYGVIQPEIISLLPAALNPYQRAIMYLPDEE